ncbi:MAG: hypothetical protein IPJ77_14805 [Planctomycetes bacterium]|nr:hypothetical protein [Planctomycetota bacterium]
MRRSLDTALILLFSAALVTPTLSILLRPTAVTTDVERELRTPAPLPPFPITLATLRETPPLLDAYFNDRLGLRDVLLRQRSILYIETFHRSPTPNAVLGRSNWVFPTLMGILDAARGTSKLAEKRLELWQQTLESRRAFCASHGAEYVAAFAPEKPTVYPDFLPSHLELRPPTAYDQLLAHLDARSDLRLLDLRGCMLDERARDHDDDFAYYPLGTHWTDRALYRAYELVHARLSARFTGLAPTPLADLHWMDDPLEGDTWARNLRMEGRMRQRARVLREIESGYECELGRPKGGATHVVVRGPDPSRPRLLLFHDSFGDRMRKLFARDFSEAYFCWGAFDPALVVSERPDVVLELRAERQLLLDRPAPIVVPGHDPLAIEFDACSIVLGRVDAAEAGLALVPVDGATIERVDDGFATSAGEGRGGTLELDALVFRAGSGVIARLDVESKHADVLDLLYLTKRVPRYRRGQVATATIPAGRHVIFVDVDEPDLVGALRFRLGRAADSVVLRSLEVRSR